MTTLVTGSKGFLGSHILENTRKSFPEKTFISITRKSLGKGKFHKDNYVVDLNSFEHINDMMYCKRLQPVERIIHCAGNPIVKISDKNPSKHIDDNIKITNNLLYSCPENTHFIFMSSITVYGDYKPSIEYPFTESHPFKPASLYAASKVSCEYIISSYKNIKNIRPCIIRPVAIVGKYSNHGVVYDFVKKLISDSKYLEVLGNYPGSEKPYVHGDDFADFISLCVKTNVEGIFNVSNDDILSTEKIANIVMDSIGIKKEILWTGNNWSGDNPVIKASSNKARTLGWKPKCNSEESVALGAKEIYESLIKSR